MSKICTIAAFDFDGTITYRDTLLPFLFFSKGFFTSCLNILCELPTLIGYTLGLKSRQEVKERLISRFYKGMPKEQLFQIGKQYAKTILNKKLKAEAIEKLRWHQQQGHRCILISANLDVYLNTWAEIEGFNDIICSEVGFDRGLVSGKLKRNNCWGEEKSKRLEALLGKRSDYLLYAYGNSRGDHELLMLADYPFYCTF